MTNKAYIPVQPRNNIPTDRSRVYPFHNLIVNENTSCRQTVVQAQDMYALKTKHFEGLSLANVYHTRVGHSCVHAEKQLVPIQLHPRTEFWVHMYLLMAGFLPGRRVYSNGESAGKCRAAFKILLTKIIIGKSAKFWGSILGIYFLKNILQSRKFATELEEHPRESVFQHAIYYLGADHFTFGVAKVFFQATNFFLRNYKESFVKT